MNIETLPAQDYFHNGAPGVVVVVSGITTHFTGEYAKHDAQRYKEDVERGLDNLLSLFNRMGS